MSRRTPHPPSGHLLPGGEKGTAIPFARGSAMAQRSGARPRGPARSWADEGAAEGWYVRRGARDGSLDLGAAPGVARTGPAGAVRPGLARPAELGRGRQRRAALPPERVGRRVRPHGDGDRTRARNGDHDPEPDGFLILDDDEPDAPGPGGGGGARATAHPADEPAGWYYADAGMPQGPVAFSELKHLARDGRIGPGTLYWRSGLEQWTPGSDLAELNVLWRHDADAGARGRRSDPPAPRAGS